MLEMVFYSLRLFVVGGERIAVVGHICTQNIKFAEAICVAMATCNFVGKLLLLVCQISLS